MTAVGVVSRGVRAKRRQTARRAEERAGLLFVTPWLFALLVFTLLPLLATFLLGFANYSAVALPTYAGLDNYRALFDDPAFWKATRNTALFAVCSVPIKLLLALGLALLLNMGGRSAGIYRTIFYLPALVPAVAGSILFMLLLTPGAGPVNVILQAIGLSPPDWLKDPVAAFWTLVLISLWPLGIETLIFLSGLKEIPSDVQDAATLDSDKPWHRFFWITLPLLTPMILFNLVIGIIGSFQIFTQAIVLGGTTGRPSEATLMVMVMIYRAAFRYFNMGYAAALSTLLFIAVLALTLLIFRTARSWVHYEGESR
jgi:multiple sugar transport system permease protein